MRKRICVFCGSHFGNNPNFETAAAKFGTRIAEEGRELIYGGSNCGYMGTVSTAAIKAGGRVVGVIPSFFTDAVITSQPVDELIMVDTMGERKRIMSERCDAFVALPGGVGTLDEITEMLTANQLGFDVKPIALLNVDGYYDCFIAQMERLLKDGLVNRTTYNSMFAADSVARLLEMIDGYDSGEISDNIWKVRDHSGVRL